MSDPLAAELLALRDRQGLIHAAGAVEWARLNPSSRLHEHLVWDDAVAGERYRIWQVRRLIAVHIVDNQGERRVVSLSVDRHVGGYRHVTDVLRAPRLREVMLQDALGELQRVQRRFQHVKELAAVWAETDKAVKRHGKPRPEAPQQGAVA